jgi:hypothetical protein
MEVLLVLSWLGISTATSTAQRLVNESANATGKMSAAEFLALATAWSWACLSTAMLMGARWSVSAKEIATALRLEKLTASWTASVTASETESRLAILRVRDSATAWDSNSDAGSDGWSVTA